MVNFKFPIIRLQNCPFIKNMIHLQHGQSNEAQTRPPDKSA